MLLPPNFAECSFLISFPTSLILPGGLQWVQKVNFHALGSSVETRISAEDSQGSAALSQLPGGWRHQGFTLTSALETHVKDGWFFHHDMKSGEKPLLQKGL